MGDYFGSEELGLIELFELDYRRKEVAANIQSHSRREEEVPSERMAMTSCSVKEEEEGAEAMRELPEEIVLKIIAMVPFPSIFQAAGLSKAWWARFSPSISGRLTDGGKERGPAASFQKQVIEDWSKNWETFSPVFISEDHLVTYGHKSRNWRRFSLSFLPRNLFHSCHAIRSSDMQGIQIEGALLYRFLGTFDRQEMYVADILTQRWKQLPPPPGKRTVFSKVVSNTSWGTYKVILFCREYCGDLCLHGHDHFSANIYESHSETWSTLNFGVTGDFFRCAAHFESASAGAAYLNGVLYMVTRMNLQHLLAFNLAESTLQELELKFNDGDTNRVDNVSLFICNDNRLMMVTTRFSMVVLEVDLHSLQLIRLCRGPPAPFKVWNIDPKPVSDGNCIFFRGRGGETVLDCLAYNMNEDAWSSWPIPAPLAPYYKQDHKTYHLIRSSFQPSLSAFVSL